MAENKQNIILIGFKGCGKSALAPLLAARTGKTWLDTDKSVEEEYARTQGTALLCRDIYALHGEAFFRDLESACLNRLAAIRNAVIATGGGIVTREDNIFLLRGMGFVVFLDVEPETLYHRLRGYDSALLRAGSPAALYSDRHPLYARAAHLRLTDIPGHCPHTAADYICARIKEACHDL